MIMTTDEVAVFLKVNKATIRRLAALGKIPCKKVGKSWRFVEADLIDWLSENDTICSKSTALKQGVVAMALIAIESLSDGDEQGARETLRGLAEL